MVLGHIHCWEAEANGARGEGRGYGDRGGGEGGADQVRGTGSHGGACHLLHLKR